jgi:hypothetical protein
MLRVYLQIYVEHSERLARLMSAPRAPNLVPLQNRITLDGTPVEAVDELAKDLATKQLIRLALRERREAACRDLARSEVEMSFPPSRTCSSEQSVA